MTAKGPAGQGSRVIAVGLGPEPGYEPLEDGLVKRVAERHAANMPGDPADGAFDRFEIVELDPDPLADGRPFDKLDLAAFGRGIDQSDPEWVHSGAPDPDLGIQFQAADASRPRRAGLIGAHCTVS